MPKPSKLTAAKTKKTKRNARIVATAVILVSVMILIAAAVAVLVYNAITSANAPTTGSAPRNPRRITLYTNYYGLDGGACSNYEYEIIGKTKSKSLKTCVDNVEKATDLIPSTGVYTSSPQDGIRLIKIDADVHTETQKRSPTTPKPQYENREVIVIDNVYSAELFVSNTNE
jgi:hypothetical protein